MDNFCENLHRHALEPIPAPITTPTPSPILAPISSPIPALTPTRNPTTVPAPIPASTLFPIPVPILASTPVPTPESQNLIINQDKSLNVEAYTDILNLHMHPDIIKATTAICSELVKENDKNGFSCVISTQEGVVMHTTASITSALGFPEDMWIGRLFIEFVHPSDRNTFTSQISNRIVNLNNTNRAHLQEQASVTGELLSKMVCRIRRYKDLNSGFEVTDREVTYTPFMLKFYCKTLTEDEEVIYLVIEGSPILSAFTQPNEVITKPKPFVIKHTPNGKLEYIDTESVQYLGYLPQDIVQKDILQLYYPSDLIYLRQVYETIMREGGLERSKPYRMKTQNGDFLKLETEWSSFTNPSSKKLEFVIARYFIIEGPKNPDVFQTLKAETIYGTPCEEDVKAQVIRDNIVSIMNEILAKPAEASKMETTKDCQDLSSILDAILDEIPEPEQEIHIKLQDNDKNYNNMPDLKVLDDIFPNEDYLDSHIDDEIPLTYKQVNDDDNLLRFFDKIRVTEEAINQKASIKELTNKSSDVDDNSSKNMDEIGSISDSSSIIVLSTLSEINGCQFLRLTESLMNKHNFEMEQKLLKLHSEIRLFKRERDNALTETQILKQRMVEHLARCNAPFQPTGAELTIVDQKRGTKRPANVVDGLTKNRPFKKPYVQSALPARPYVPSPWYPRPLSSVFNKDTNMICLDKQLLMPKMSQNNIGTAGMLNYHGPTDSRQVPNRTERAYSSLPYATYHRDSIFNRDPNVIGVDKQPLMPKMSQNNIGTAGMLKYYGPTDSPYHVPNWTKTAYSSLPSATYHRGSNISTLNRHSMEYQNKVPQINRNSVYPHNMPCHIYQQNQEVILNSIPKDLTNQQYQQNMPNHILPANMYRQHQQIYPYNKPLDIMHQHNQQNNPCNVLPNIKMNQPHLQNNHFNIRIDITYEKKQKNNPNNILPHTNQQHQQNNLGNILPQHRGNHQMQNMGQQFHGSPYKVSPVQLHTPQKLQQNYTSEQKLFNELVEFSSDYEESSDERSKKKVLFDNSDSNDTSEINSSYSSFNHDSGINEMSDAKSQKRKKIIQDYLDKANDDLNQLYVDLQLQDVSGKITLDEGITSSSCSEDERSNHAKISTSKSFWKNRASKKMLVIHESTKENALLPNLSTTGDSGNYSGES